MAVMIAEGSLFVVDGGESGVRLGWASRGRVCVVGVEERLCAWWDAQ